MTRDALHKQRRKIPLIVMREREREGKKDGKKIATNTDVASEFLKEFQGNYKSLQKICISSISEEGKTASLIIEGILESMTEEKVEDKLKENSK